jgi:undecaprenyl diphosphate synthase
MNYNSQNFHPSYNKCPIHVGIIPDGTRRWAKKNNHELFDAYFKAMILLGDIVKFLFTQDVKIISLYFSSLQNFKRPKDEIDAFCNAEAIFCENILKKLLDEYSFKVNIIGDRSYIPCLLLEKAEEIENQTKKNDIHEINLCIAYNPIIEIQNAIKSSTVTDFLHNLQVKQPLDIVIRSSDANLLSNFLPLQSGFARLYFIEKLFNDISVKDIECIINSFQNIERKYGE